LDTPIRKSVRWHYCKYSFGAYGKKLGIGAMLLRVLIAGIVYGITLGIALIVSVFMVVFRKDKRSLHDMMAGTYVTYSKPGEIEEKPAFVD